MKYNYKYDDQNRMTESEALKWNSTKNTWGKDMCIRYAYQEMCIRDRNLTDAFCRNFEKKTRRDQTRHINNPKLKDHGEE